MKYTIKCLNCHKKESMQMTSFCKGCFGKMIRLNEKISIEKKDKGFSLQINRSQRNKIGEKYLL